MRRRIIAFFMSALMVLAPVAPAHALFGFGGIVFDPQNYGQNLLTAARTLQTINNQIKQLQNEADMLINQAQDLASLPFSARQHLTGLMNEISSLMQTARAISFEVDKADQIFKQNYPQDYAAMSHLQMTQNAETLWNNSRSSFHDALLMQSKIVETVQADTAMLDQLVQQSQGAGGNLAVAQAGNQLMALNAKQVMQLQQMMAAQYRAETLERARHLQIERAAKVRHQRFVGAASAYGN